MNQSWNYVPFAKLFDWKAKSQIKSGSGKARGKYKMFVCSDTEIKRYDEYLETEESLIFGTGGKASCHYVNEPFAYSTDCVVAQKKSDDVFTKFYYYFFRQNQLNLLQSTFTGSGLQHTSKAKIEKIIVPFISYKEQEFIVSKIEELFSELDKSVEALKKVKEQLVMYRQAVFNETFVFVPSELVEICSIVDDIRIGPFGTMLHKSDYIENGIPVINPQHIKSLSIIENKKVSVSVEKADELSAYQLKFNDIIMGRRGEMGRAAAISMREQNWICGTGSILFRLKPNYEAGFYAQILSSPYVVHYLEDHATGTTMKNLNEEIVKQIPVPNITKEMQKKITNEIGEKLSVCHNIEKTINLALQETEVIRQSILRKAFEERLI